MANFAYDTGKEGIVDRSIDYLGGNIKVACCSAAYTPNAATDKFVTDLAGIVARSGNLASKTATLGVLDAADITITAVTGSQITQFVLYLDSGVDATSRLILNLNAGLGLPFTPSGSDLPIQWANGAAKIWKL